MEEQAQENIPECCVFFKIFLIKMYEILKLTRTD